MARQFIRHTTIAGERWDMLAWNYYGDPTLFSAIITANPLISIEPVFEPGLQIRVPILQASPVRNSDLPPWKRTGQ
jgi:phage tail protein X